MFNEKRGLSTVVTTLIIILLVLVAIGIVWIVIKGIIESGTQSVDYATKCLRVDVRATAVACANQSTNAECSVTLTRKASGDVIKGVKLVFYNNASQVSSVFDSTDYGTGTTDIAPLAIKTTSIITTGLANVNKVDVTPFFLDQAGNEQVCTTTNSFSF